MARVTFGQIPGAQPAPKTAQPAPAAKVAAPVASVKPAAPVPAAARVPRPKAVKPTPAPAAPVEDTAPAKPNPFRKAPPAPEPAPIEVTAEVVQEQDAQQEAAAPVTALAPAQTTALTRPQSLAGIFEDVADIDFKDLQLPRLNLVQKSGVLANSFSPGDLVLMREVPLTAPLVVIFLGFRKTTFVERVGDGEEGMVCATEGDVATAGGTTEWTEHKETGKPLFYRFTTALLMVQAPADFPDEHVDSYFPYEVEGSRWALCAFSFKGPSYNQCVKPLKTKRRFGMLRNGYHTHFFTLNSELKLYKTGKDGWIPVVTDAGVVPEGFLNSLAELMSSFSGDAE